MKNWWKILGVILLLYSFVVGMLVPLKPGVRDIAPFKLDAGKKSEVNIYGYNTFYTQTKTPIRVWLNVDSIHALAAKSVAVISDNHLVAEFDMPAYYPGNDQAVSLSLWVDSDADGAATLPDAISVIDNHPDNTTRDNIWTQQPIDNLSNSDRKTFPYRSLLGETIRNTYYHVPFWFAMMLILLSSMIFSWKYLQTLEIRYDHTAVALAQVGVLYGILGLITGSIWARFTWGDWWNFDIKQNMSAIAMLIYMAFFVLRSSFDDEEKKARISNVYNIFAFSALVPLLFVIPRLYDSLHPGNGGNPGFGGDDLDSTMRMVLYPAVFGWLLLGLWMAQLLKRISALRDKLFFD